MLKATSNFPMPIITPRLILRPPFNCDNKVNEYYDAITESMNELQPWLLWAKFHPTINQIKKYIEMCNANWITKEDNNIGLNLWIIDKKSDKVIGGVVMWNIVWETSKLEIGFWIRTSESKKGYVTETVNALTRYSFLALGVKRIEIKCEAKNINAKKVPKRSGFKFDGILHNATKAVSNDELTDVLLFSCEDLKNLPELDVAWGI